MLDSNDTPDAHPELVKELQAPPSVDKNKRMTLSTRVAELERRMDDVITAQAANAPIFRAALERILKMREALHEHGNSLMRLEALATKATVAQETTAANIAEVLGYMKHARTWAGYAKKYTPRTLTLILGVAVGRGWITAENGHNLLSIFVH